MDLEHAKLLLQHLEDDISEEEFYQTLKEAQECLSYDFNCQICGCISYRKRKIEFRPTEIVTFEDVFYIAQCSTCLAVNFSINGKDWFANHFSKYSSILINYFEDMI